MHRSSRPDEQRARRACLVAIAAGAAVLAAPAMAQDLSPVRPNEAIGVPGGTLTVLAADIQPGETTAVTLRLRAYADAKSSLALRNDTFRLLAAGVPRVPSARVWTDVAPDSAEDFVVAFKIPDKTDDLVLQMRFGDTVLRRRLSKR